MEVVVGLVERTPIQNAVRITGVHVNKTRNEQQRLEHLDVIRLLRLLWMDALTEFM